jgi:hypothetical protein
MNRCRWASSIVVKMAPNCFDVIGLTATIAIKAYNKSISPESSKALYGFVHGYFSGETNTSMLGWEGTAFEYDKGEIRLLQFMFQPF